MLARTRTSSPRTAGSHDFSPMFVGPSDRGPPQVLALLGSACAPRRLPVPCRAASNIRERISWTEDPTHASPGSVLARTRTSSPRTAARVRWRARQRPARACARRARSRSSVLFYKEDDPDPGSPRLAPHPRTRSRQPTCAAAAASSWASATAPRRDSQAWDLRLCSARRRGRRPSSAPREATRPTPRCPAMAAWPRRRAREHRARSLASHRTCARVARPTLVRSTALSSEPSHSHDFSPMFGGPSDRGPPRVVASLGSAVLLAVFLFRSNVLDGRSHALACSPTPRPRVHSESSEQTFCSLLQRKIRIRGLHASHRTRARSLASPRAQQNRCSGDENAGSRR